MIVQCMARYAYLDERVGVRTRDKEGLGGRARLNLAKFKNSKALVCPSSSSLRVSRHVVLPPSLQLHSLSSSFHLPPPPSPPPLSPILHLQRRLPHFLFRRPSPLVRRPLHPPRRPDFSRSQTRGSSRNSAPASRATRHTARAARSPLRLAFPQPRRHHVHQCTGGGSGEYVGGLGGDLHAKAREGGRSSWCHRRRSILRTSFLSPPSHTLTHESTARQDSHRPLPRSSTVPFRPTLRPPSHHRAPYSSLATRPRTRSQS